MCLDTISRKKPPKTGKGWKRFDVRNDKLHSFWQGPYSILGRDALPISTWIKKHNHENEVISTSKSGPYLSGFHIWKEKPSLRYKDLSILPVRYRKGHTQGMDGDIRTIVADEIFIPKPKRRKT